MPKKTLRPEVQQFVPDAGEAGLPADTGGVHDHYLNKIKALIPAGSILNPLIHDKLVLVLDKYSKQSGVPVKFITHSVKGVGTDDDVRWLTKLRALRKEGRINWYTSDEGAIAPEIRFMALAGGCLRNFIDGRIRTAHELYSEYPDLDFTGLFVPNFWVEGVTEYNHKQMNQIYSTLMQRSADHRITVLYISDVEKFKAQQPWLARFITENYNSIESLEQ